MCTLLSMVFEKHTYYQFKRFLFSFDFFFFLNIIIACLYFLVVFKAHFFVELNHILKSIHNNYLTL